MTKPEDVVRNALDEARDVPACPDPWHDAAAAPKEPERFAGSRYVTPEEHRRAWHDANFSKRGNVLIPRAKRCPTCGYLSIHSWPHPSHEPPEEPIDYGYPCTGDYGCLCREHRLPTPKEDA